MTWKEFKDEIDKQLKDRDLDESTEVVYIDVLYPVREKLVVKIDVAKRAFVTVNYTGD